MMKVFDCRDKRLFSENGPYVMGIVNVTPDSFSDGGKYFEAEKAVNHALEMTEHGVDLIDLGAMSTGPGSVPVSPAEEIARLEPVLAVLLESTSCILSVDTVNPETAELAMEYGAHIINDVSGCFNADMASVVKKYNAGWIVTHTANVPAGSIVDYKNGVLAAVKEYFDDTVRKCTDIGIDKTSICLDPGFGFAKTTEDNIMLLKNLENIISDDIFFLTGLSKKRFIGEITGSRSAEDRLAGTITADVIALRKGSDIIRVHDVNAAVQSVKMLKALR